MVGKAVVRKAVVGKAVVRKAMKESILLRTGNYM